MKYEKLIQAEYKNMSKSFTRLADFILDSYTEAAFMKAGELAQAVGVDPATVVRFSQFLGYTGYPELHNEIQEKVKKELFVSNRKNSHPNSAADIVSIALNDLSAVIEHLHRTLDVSEIESLIKAIGECRNIVLVAEGLTIPAANTLSNYFKKLGKSISVAQPDLFSISTELVNANPQDLLIMIELSGRNSKMELAIQGAKSKGIITAAIVSAPSSPSARAADIVISISTPSANETDIIRFEILAFILVRVMNWQFSNKIAKYDEEFIALINQIQSQD